MSSGFVSGGTNDAPIERDPEWLQAQQELEANRALKAAEARPTDGKSLYETLEANKAAKQDAFEEANRLKNQFRSLDEDEIEFLDSVLESTRVEEERVKRETREGLEVFRRQQEEADKKVRSEGTIVEDGSPVAEEEQWVVGGRKRKRTKDKEVLKGVKIRRTSSAAEDAKKVVVPAMTTLKPATVDKKQPKETEHKGSIKKGEEKHSPLVTATASKTSPARKFGLGLVAYGSDSDDD